MRKKHPAIKYSSLFNNMLDGFAYCQVIFDDNNNPIDYTYIEVNENFEKLSGIKNVVGKKISDLIPGIRESNPEVFEVFGRVINTGQPEVFETYINPLKRWFLISVYCQSKGYIILIFQNVTDRKHVEQKLQDAKTAARNVLMDLNEEKAKLAHEKATDEAMLASIGDGVIIVDRDGLITFINKAAEKLFGWTRQEALGKVFVDFLVLEDDQGLPASDSSRAMTIALTTDTATLAKQIAAQSSKPTPIYYYTRKDKTKFPVAMSISRVMLENKIIGAIGAYRDVTKEQEIDRAKTEFVSLASHQLKTPPTAIKLLSERMLNGRIGTLNEKQKEYFGDIQTSNQRMIDLVNTLLNVSRIEMGTFSMNPVMKDINGFLRDIVSEHTLALSQKQIDLKTIISPSPLNILIDDPMFHMVVNNLLTNAIKYTPVGGKIRLEGMRVNKDSTLGGKLLEEDYYAIMVTDSGLGIPHNQKNKIFTKFFRADNAREREPEGNGLGLYIVKSVLDHSGGAVWFESPSGTSEVDKTGENKGTTFYVVIPLTGMRALHKQLITA